MEIDLLIKKITKRQRKINAVISNSNTKSNYHRRLKLSTSKYPKILKKNKINKSNQKSKFINKSTQIINNNQINSNLDVINLMIKNSPLQYNHIKIKEKAKQINPLFNKNKFIIKDLAKNTQNVFYRYNLLYGNNTPNFIRTYSPKMRPMSSSVKLFTRIVKKAKEDKNILKDDEVLKLIKAKCKDIGIDYRDIMYHKFKDFCNSKCKNRIADFSECYFGINSIKVISELLIDTNRISRLNLTKNNIGDAGLEIVVNSVKNSISLVSLNITSNSINIKEEI